MKIALFLSMVTTLGLASNARAAEPVVCLDANFGCDFVNLDGKPVRMEVMTTKEGPTDILINPTANGADSKDLRYAECKLKDKAVTLTMSVPLTRKVGGKEVFTGKSQDLPAMRLKWVEGVGSKKWKIQFAAREFAPLNKNSYCTDGN